MIRETVTPLDPEWGELVAVDVLETGEWAGLFRVDDRLFLRTARESISVPHGAQPSHLRFLDMTRFVIADSSAEKGRASAWILSLEQEAPLGFFAGHGIEDVLVTKGMIVVTYSDEGIFSGTALSREGIAVFSSYGEYRTGYLTALGSEAVEIYHCYAACWDADSRLVFMPYNFDYPLVRWRVGTRDQTVEAAPRSGRGTHAISLLGETMLLFGGYGSANTMFEWMPGQEPRVIGKHRGQLRGLRNGRFLTHGKHEFTIIERATKGDLDQ